MINQIKLKADVKLSVKSDGLDYEKLDKETEAEIVLRFEQFLNSMSKVKVELEDEEVFVYPRFHLWFSE